MPSVAVAHTAEKHFSVERVLSLLREALNHLGGLEAFVRPGESVLIIPSQAVWCSSEAACAPDPLLVGSLIRLARNAGAGRVQVAGVGGTAMSAAVEREGAELIDLGSDGVPNRQIELPEGSALHNVPLPVPLLEADVIIAVPKAKNHYLDLIGGTLEVWQGVVSRNWLARSSAERDTIELFADIMAAVRPDLCITDALICGEGDGPLANLPRCCGGILASSDPIAMDVAIARLLGREWEKLRFAAEGEKRGLGRREPLVWLGTPLERIAFQAWPGHEGHRYLPINFLVGDGVTIAGTIGHVKSALDSLLRLGILEIVIRARGTPTVMVGDVHDSEFERHVEEGPYVVFDDAARREYKNDPRVSFVPGHPVLHDAMPQLMRALGVAFPPRNMEWPQSTGSGSKRRKLAGARTPAGVAALAFGAALGIRALARRA